MGSKNRTWERCLSFCCLKNCVREQENIEENPPDRENQETTVHVLPTVWTPDSFKALNKLDKGNFGEVFLIEHLATHEKAALKVLHKDHYDKNNITEVKSEWKGWNLASSHPHVVTLKAYFETNLSFNFISEYIPGGNLYRCIKQNGPLEETRAKTIAAQIGSAIEFIHNKGIIHRDISAKNILLSLQDDAYLSDFGLCVLNLGSCRFCGTPVYMAPEILKHLKYDKSVDWWSYGVLVYFMLVGKTPIDVYMEGIASNSEMDEMSQTFIITSALDVDLAFPDNITTDAQSFITEFLQKDAKQRLGSLNEFGIRQHPFLQDIEWP